jgi:hypothetical protein
MAAALTKHLQIPRPPIAIYMTNKALPLSFFLLPILLPALARAQTDLLILEDRGSQVRTYTVGTDLEMRTIYNQWFQGMITGMSHDSIFLDGMAFNYKEIGAVRIAHVNFSNTVLSTGMMAAAGGILVLGAVNGLYRHDPAKRWYTPSGLITGTILLVGGFVLSRTRSGVYTIGKKYKLQYLVLGAERQTSALPISPSQ